MPNAPKLAFHVSLFYSLGTITLLAGLTYVGQDIIIPVIMALLFADTLNRKLGIPAVLASIVAVGCLSWPLIGLKYAILVGIITGLLNLITYIGVIIAGAISVGTSLTGSADLSLIIAVIVVNILVQLADKNIISPMALSSKVEIYAFFSIIGFIIGGALGGISGIFLAIPLIAILKVIFGRIEPLERGYLLGDELPKTFVRNKVILTLYAQDAVLDTLTDKGARRPEKFK